MKKLSVFLIGLLTISVTVFAQVNPAKLVKGDAKIVNRVDHNQHYLVIDDNIYHMPLNVKVYTRDRLTGNYRLLNRYALKAGQTVTVGVSGTPQKVYVDVVMIMGDQ